MCFYALVMEWNKNQAAQAGEEEHLYSYLYL